MRIRTVILICLSILATSCQHELTGEGAALSATGDVNISFSNVVKNQTLNFTDEYTNAWGEKYTVSTFKYYVHNIALVTSEGKSIPLSSDYYLVDESKPETKLIALKGLTGDYRKITFTLGVDSAKNVSGAQTGVLDPVNGMFWTWSSGYVMAKLEGFSAAAASSPNGNFTYHVGGFKQPTVAIKQIALDVPASAKLSVNRGLPVTVDVKADVDTWFSRVNAIRIAEHAACHSPGDLAKQIADNYEGMFAIDKIH